MNTYKKGKDYELLVKDFLEKIFEEEGIKDFKFEHNVKLEKNNGLGTNQYDLICTGKQGGLTVRYLIECKNLNRRITQQVIDGFGKKLENTKGVRSIGVIVTTEGFQKGALENLDTYGILPVLIRKPKDEDKDGLIWNIYLNIELGSLEPHVELEISGEDEGILKSGPADNIYGLNKIVDKKNDRVIDLYDLVEEASSRPDEKTIYQFEDAQIHLPQGAFPISGVKIHFKINKSKMSHKISADNLIGYCYRVLGDKETKYFMRKDGTVFKSES